MIDYTSLNKALGIDAPLFLPEDVEEDIEYILGNPGKSEAMRRHMSEIMSGRTLSEETKNKISETLSGRNFSAEHKQNLSLSALGNTKGRANKGKKHTQEFKDNLKRLKTKPDSEVSSHALYMRRYREKQRKG